MGVDDTDLVSQPRSTFAPELDGPDEDYGRKAATLSSSLDLPLHGRQSSTDQMDSVSRRESTPNATHQRVSDNGDSLPATLPNPEVPCPQAENLETHNVCHTCIDTATDYQDTYQAKGFVSHDNDQQTYNTIDNAAQCQSEPSPLQESEYKALAYGHYAMMGMDPDTIASINAERVDSKIEGPATAGIDAVKAMDVDKEQLEPSPLQESDYKALAYGHYAMMGMDPDTIASILAERAESNVKDSAPAGADGVQRRDVGKERAPGSGCYQGAAGADPDISSGDYGRVYRLVYDGPDTVSVFDSASIGIDPGTDGNDASSKQLQGKGKSTAEHGNPIGSHRDIASNNSSHGNGDSSGSQAGLTGQKSDLNPEVSNDAVHKGLNNILRIRKYITRSPQDIEGCRNDMYSHHERASSNPSASISDQGISNGGVASENGHCEKADRGDVTMLEDTGRVDSGYQDILDSKGGDNSADQAPPATPQIQPDVIPHIIYDAMRME